MRLRLPASSRLREFLGQRATSGLAALLMTALPLVAIAGVDGISAPSPEPFGGVHAIKGARIFAAPGRVFDPGTVVVRNGTISAVGDASKVEVPSDAEVIDGKGLVVYPGFLDLYNTGGQRGDVDRSTTGRGRLVDLSEAPLVWTPLDNRRGMTPEFQVAHALDISDSFADPRRKQGFTAILSAPSGAIATGQSAFATLGGLPRREAILRESVGLHINLKTPIDSSPSSASGSQRPGGRRRGSDSASDNPFPQSLMGAVTHLRQAMIDAKSLKDLQEQAKAGGPPAPFDATFAALAATQGPAAFPTWWEANTRDEIHRALDLAKEFGMKPVIVGGREASKVLDRLKDESIPVILRLDFADEPKVPSEEEYRKKTPADREEPLSVLRDRHSKWKEQVGTAGKLAKEGITFAFGTEGMDKPESFSAKIRAVIAAGLKVEDAVKALTESAARLVGVSKLLGTIEPGKLGHVIVLSGPLNDEKARARYVLLDNQKYEYKPGEQNAPGDPSKKERRGSGADTKKTGTSPLAKEESPAPNPSEANPERKSATAPPSETKPRAKEDARREPGTDPTPASNLAEKPEPPAPKSRFEDTRAEFDEDRRPRLHTGGNVLIKDVTILTVTNGTIPKGSILILDGKIADIGTEVDVPENRDKHLSVINGEGLVAMPGIIDTHSHIAIQGSVNEFSLSAVPDIRVKDVVTGDDVSIYRAIAGGTTTARLLHGSANTIGGQDAVVKLKYGKPGRDLILRDAPQGVKFALGENVTRSRGRFPNTRMGVQSVIERAFLEGRAYRKRIEADRRKRENGDRLSSPPPRRDLRLEALADILEGTIKIHSHCYRADEILMLLGTAERYGVKVQSLQHVLEGYKVAAEIAAHGASASTFSDWWAYKIEAFDAIPQNAAILTKAGANVCIKSDSEELIRHLNIESAKMVKYGDVDEKTALSMITMNPARELGLERRVGSIEIGKDGDIAIFNGHPFDAFSRCELTLIDGEVYFERKEPGSSRGVRPGPHETMPRAADSARQWKLDVTSQPKGAVALVGATIHPATGPAIESGILIISRGKIAAVGDRTTAIPPDAQTIAMKGLDIWPGLIDSGSNIALSEVGSLNETHDYADAAQFQPELRTSYALKADSEHIPVTRANGILSAFVQPTGGVISGQGSVIDLEGWTPGELVVVDQAALHINIPAHVPNRDDAPHGNPGEGNAGGPAEARKKRQELIDRLKEQFRLALRYDAAKASERSGTRPISPVDPRLEALVPYAKGQKTVIFRASHRNEILDALSLIAELKLKGVLSEAWESWKVVEEIKKANVPVLVAGTLYTPTNEHAPYDSPYSTPARLHQAGISFAIRSNSQGPAEGTASRNLPFEAAMAVAFGLPEDEALRSITINPARILGIGHQVGSLEVGKRANIVVTAGNILQPTTPVLALFIDGKPIEPTSRHTELARKYESRLKDVRSREAK